MFEFLHQLIFNINIIFLSSLTIFKYFIYRVTSLIKGGAMKSDDKPLWYVIYEAFPPKQEPRYDRPAPNIDIKDIFYTEDVLRA